MLCAQQSQAGQYNYRALKHAFRDFEYFYPNIEEQFRKNDEFINSLCKVFIALAYEVQLGNLSPDEFLPSDPGKEYAKIIARDKDNKEEESNFDKVLKRHGVQWSAIYSASSNLIFLPDLWKRIFSNDWIDKQEISEAIQNSSYFPDKQDEWVTLWHWRRIEDDEGAKALVEVLGKLKDYEYRSYEIIMHVFSILIGLVDDGAIEESKENIFDQAQEYLNYLVNGDLLILPERSGWHWADSGSHGLGYWSKEDEYNRLVSMIDRAIATTLENKRIASVDGWLDDIWRFDSQFLTDVGTNGKYCQEPILKYIDPDKFVEALDKMPNQQKWLVGSTFEKRYEHWCNKLTEELPFWVTVQRLLAENLNKHTGLVTPSFKNLKYVEKNIESIIGTLRNAMQQEQDKKEK